MCMINLGVKHVSKTNLLIARMKLANKNNREYQFISYGNRIELDPSIKQVNSLILPVPCDSKDLIVIDSKDQWTEELIKQMKKAFDDLKPKTRSGFSFGGHTLSANSQQPQSMLEVFTAGSYIYSIAPSLNELTNYDPTQFKLSDGLCEYIKDNYAQNPYCYLILHLKHTGEYHPFMYLHPIVTDNKGNKRLFIPTRHYHPESTSFSSSPDINHPYFNPGNNNNNNNNNNKGESFIPELHGPVDNNPFYIGNNNNIISSIRNEAIQYQHNRYSNDYADDWDHDIYIMNTVLDNADIYLMKGPSSPEQTIQFGKPRGAATDYNGRHTKCDRMNYPTSTTNYYDLKTKWCKTIIFNMFTLLKQNIILDKNNVTRLEIQGKHLNGDLLVNIDDIKIDPDRINKGTNCDGCKEENFKGTRWACITCNLEPYYDLCNKCYSNRNNIPNTNQHTNNVCLLTEVNTEEQEKNVVLNRMITQSYNKYNMQ